MSGPLLFRVAGGQLTLAQRWNWGIIAPAPTRHERVETTRDTDQAVPFKRCDGARRTYTCADAGARFFSRGGRRRSSRGRCSAETCAQQRGVRKSSREAFAWSCVARVRLPTTLRKAGKESSHGCGKLRRVDLPGGLESVFVPASVPCSGPGLLRLQPAGEGGVRGGHPALGGARGLRAVSGRPDQIRVATRGPGRGGVWLRSRVSAQLCCRGFAFAAPFSQSESQLLSR